MNEPMEQRTLPHNLEAEKCVLGAILIDNQQFIVASQVITDQHFFRDAHRRIWNKMAVLAERGVEIDLVTLKDELANSDELDEVGGPAYIAALTDGVPRASNVDHYAKIVKEKYDLRNLIHSARKILASAYESDDTSSEAFASAQDHIIETVEQMLSRQGLSRPLDSAAQIEKFEQSLRAEQTRRLPLGLSHFDWLSKGGIRPGEVMAILARPSVGKTVLMCNIANAQAVREVGHVIFSLEMEAVQLVERLIQIAYGMSDQAIRDLMASGEFYSEGYCDYFKNLVIVDTPGLSVSAMSAILKQVEKAVFKHVPLGLVSIDHLGLIGGDDNMRTYDRVSKQSRQIKELAKRHGCGAVVAVQVSREAGGDGDRRLSLAAARDSGVVEEAADYMMGWRRLDYSTTLSEEKKLPYVNVLFGEFLKNRHGKRGGEVAFRMSSENLQMEQDDYLKPLEDERSKYQSKKGW